MRRPARAWCVGSFVLLATLLAAPDAEGQTHRPSCESCHGELEFLRQHTESLDEARALFAPARTLAASVHGRMTCTDCHEGFRRFPHPDAATTRSCASCHEETAQRWREGMHALDNAAQCRDCHGTHDVRGKEARETPEGIRAMRAACTACHYAPGIPASDPHAGVVSCAGCHEPHANLPEEDERSSIHARNQASTCGACHAEEASAWKEDVHAAAVLRLTAPGGEPPEGISSTRPPSCTACHGSHGIVPRESAEFRRAVVARCARCHEPYRVSFADSYHGQASTLGSTATATCHDCHGSHEIYPASDPRSSVHEGNVLATCRTCHENATAGFALFQPHADPHDRERYPYVYWAYHLMTALLVGTFTLFGIHTVLWLTRIAIESLRGGAPHARESRGG